MSVSLLTMLGQAISFFLFVWFCMKFIWPPLISAIEDRQASISKSLASAEIAEKELTSTKDEALKLIKQAKEDAAVIIKNANDQKQRLLEEVKEEALREKNKIVAQGLIEVDFERKKAHELLRHQVAGLVIAGAEKVIKQSVDESANQRLIDELIAEL